METGKFYLSSQSINPSRPAFKHYLFAKIATPLSFSRRRSWPRLSCFSSLGWALLPAAEVGFKAVVGQESSCVLLGVFGFTGHRAATQGRGKAPSLSAAPTPSNSSCPSGKECLFYRIPVLFNGKTGTILSFQVCISSIESGN